MAIKSFLSEGGFSVGSVGAAPIEVIDSSGNITAVGLTVSGNLTVNGSTTTINSTTTTLDDPIFTLGGDTVPTTDDNKDRGIEFRWHDGSLAKVGFFGFDDSTGKFVFIPNATNTSEVFSGTKGTIDANLEWADVLNKPDPVVTVTLAGDVTGTGNATLTDLGNGTITINTTVNSDAVALGTDTTGNYVASITNGSYITGGNGGSEGAALTLAVDATSANTFGKVVARDGSGNFSAGTITAAGGVIASGLTANSWLVEARGTAVYGGFAQYGNNIKSVQYWNASNTISVGSSYSANVANDGDLIVSGKIGVGTLSPGGKLEVNFTAAIGATALILRTSDSGANGAIRWQNSGGTNQAGIGSNFNVSDVGALEFLNGTTTNVIFRSSGNVGIGTTAPQTRLHAYTSTTDTTSAGRTTALNVLTLESENTADLEYNGFGQGLVFRGSTYNNSTQRTLGRIVHKINDDSVSTTRGTSIHFETSDNATNTNAPTEKMVINYAGNVGIGKSNPQQKLHLAGTNARIAISNDSDNNWAEIGNDGASGQNTLEFFTGSSSVPVMSITHGNSVGVGITAPSAKLHVSEASGVGNFAALKLTNTVTSVNANVDIIMEAGGQVGARIRAIAPGASHNDLAMYVTNSGTLQATPAIFIQGSTNRVGINRSDPSNTLDVNGSVRTTDWYYVENSGNGMYNNANAMWWASHGSGSYSLSSNTTFSGIKLFSGGSQNTFRGHFYGDSAGQGFLDSSGNWALQLDSSKRLQVYSGVYSIENGTIRVFNPGGATYSDGPALTGAFKIKLPTATYNSNTMMTLVVDIYNYDTGKSLRFRVGGYNYQTGDWYNTFAEQTSDLGVAAYNVRFGSDGTSNCIWIGETNSSWSYPKVYVSQFLGGHSTATAAWASGWTITRVTAFDTVGATRAASVTVNSNNIGAYGVNYITGTANQVLVNGGSGANVTGGVTLTLPQSIATTSTPTFGGIAVGGSGIQNGFIADLKGNTVVRGGLYTVAGAASIDGNIGATGNLTVSGGTITGAANTSIQGNTTDGSDTGSLSIGGGGALSYDRGAYASFYGNEYSSREGELRLVAGNGSVGTINFYTNGNSTARVSISKAGDVSTTGNLAVGSTLSAKFEFSPSYTSDGVWSANARPSTFTGYNSNSTLLIGYSDDGGGSYYPSIGFKCSGDAFATSAAIIGSRYRTTAGVLDAADRFQIQAAGKILWGSGSAAQDVTLHRSAASTLAVTGNLTVSGTLTTGGNIIASSYDVSANTVTAGGTYTTRITGDGSGAYINFGTGGNSGLGKIGRFGSLMQFDSDTPFSFKISSSEKFRIDTSGNVGILNTAPSEALEVGTNAAGKNVKVNSTLGSELIPALTAGNWSGTNWSATGTTITHTTGTTGSISPVSALTITAGKVYKVVMTLSAGGTNYINFSLGGKTYKFTSAATQTWHVYAINTNSFSIFNYSSGDATTTITSISIKEVVATTGTLSVDGPVTFNSTLAINNLGIGTPSTWTLGAPLEVIDYGGNAIRLTRQGVPTQYLALHTGDGGAYTIGAYAFGNDKPFIISTDATVQGIQFATGLTPTRKAEVAGDGTFYARNLYDIESTSYFVDPGATGTAATLAGSVNIDGGINFLRGSGEYSTYIKASDYIDAGYNSSTLRYWIELGAKGGTHIVLNTDGSATAAENSYDHFTIWQAVNGTGAIAAGARKFWITNTGRVNFIDSVWHKSSDGIERIHFGSSGTTFYKGGGTGTIHTFRNASDVDILTLSNARDAILSGNLAVNSTTDATAAPTGSISASGGIAVGTNKKFMATGTGGYWGAPSVGNQETLLIRATGFGYNPTSYAGVQIGGTAGRSIVFGVDVSAIAGSQFTGAANEWIIPNTLNIRQVTSAGTDFSSAIFTIGNGGAVTVAGNLTVSGTGTSSVGGAFNIGANCYVPNANFYRGKNAAGSSDYRLIGVTSGNVVSIDADATGATFGGNITVSGGSATVDSGSSGIVTVGYATALSSSNQGNSAIGVVGRNLRASSTNDDLLILKTNAAIGAQGVVFKTGTIELYTVSGSVTAGNVLSSGLAATFTTATSTIAGNLTVSGTGTSTIGGNLTVSGNLIINGTTTTVNSTTTTLDDPIITLGGDTAPTVDDNKDRGVEFRWHNGTAAKTGFFGYDDSSGYFTFIPDATNTSEVFSGTKGTIDANLVGNVTGNVSGTAAGETLATVTGRGASTSSQISVTTSSGGSMFTGTKSGSGYSDGVSGATFKSILDNPNGGAGFAFVSYYNASGGTIGASIRADGFTTLTYNPVASLANNAFSITTGNYGSLHFDNGEGTTGNARQTGITWRGGSTNVVQAGIYVSQNSATGTTMALATTDNYSTGPQIGMTISTTGVVNFPRNRPTYAGNTILDAANYNSYALPLSGGTLTGKVTFPSAVNDRPQFPGGILGLDTTDGNFDIWGISRDYYPSHGTAANQWGIRWDGDSNQVRFIGAGSNRLVIDLDGGASALTWEGSAVLHAGNYNSYAPTLTGTGASGTWGINVTGSAGSATSAGYLTGGDSNFYAYLLNNNSGDLNTYNQPGLYSSEYIGSTNNPAGASNNGHWIQISDAGGTDVKTQWYYHNAGSDISMRLMWGNGSWRSWRKLLHDGNYNSYAPTLTGTGASGTWGISITGNAATATTASNVNNGTLTLAVSGTGLSGSASFTANQSGNSTFTVTSNATSANAVSTIVARDSNGDFNSRNITLTGSLNAVTKSFVIKHPTKEGKKLRYGSLEGPENGVYVRGKLKGSNIIELPDYWTKLVDPESITVQLTPIGSHQKLYVEKIEDNKVYIVNENLLAKAINCFFYVLAERCDVEKLEVEIDA